MSVETVSRTFCRIACLYCFTLFATSIGLAAAYTSGYRHANLCALGRCAVVAEVPMRPPALAPAVSATAAHVLPIIRVGG